MNSLHLVVVAAVVLACPTAIPAQSIVQSELTATTLTSSTDATGRVTLGASVATLAGSGVPGGTIRFIDETSLSLLGWADVAHPSIVIERPSVGPHRFRADYSGTADYLPLMIQPSRSVSVAYSVGARPDVSISSSENPCVPGSVVTLTAAIAGPGRAPKGTVTFRDGQQVLAAHVALDRAGTASFTTSALPDGLRSITVEYEGDAGHAPALSPQLLQDVGGGRIRNSLLESGD